MLWWISSLTWETDGLYWEVRILKGLDQTSNPSGLATTIYAFQYNKGTTRRAGGTTGIA